MNEIEEYIGKVIVMGLTFLDENDKITEQTQKAGTIVEVNEYEILVDVGEDEPYAIPAMFDAIRPAEKNATYELKATGEKVKNPDFVCCWTIKQQEM